MGFALATLGWQSFRRSLADGEPRGLGVRIWPYGTQTFMPQASNRRGPEPTDQARMLAPGILASRRVPPLNPLQGS
jgi:hypothetical protein